MSVEYVQRCDVCGGVLTKETTADPDSHEHRDLPDGRRAPQRMRIDTAKISLLVFLGPPGHAAFEEGGDYCKYCVIDAVNMLDDRPVQEQR